jgi:hypothetical protein
MKPNFMFKVHGVHRLITYEELMRIKASHSIHEVKVVDLQTQKNWNTSFATIARKFK